MKVVGHVLDSSVVMSMFLPLMTVEKSCRDRDDCGNLAIVGQAAINWFFGEIEPLFEDHVPPQLMTIIRALVEHTFDLFTRSAFHMASEPFS
jgi:hypothetical protein